MICKCEPIPGQSEDSQDEEDQFSEDPDVPLSPKDEEENNRRLRHEAHGQR